MEPRGLEAMERYGVVPVVALDSEDVALPLADALSAGGLPLVEITFRTEAAAAAIRRIVEARPQMTVGAGTVLTVEHLETAKACGAQFAVAPGLNPTIVRRAQQLEMPFIPGVATPSEIEIALELGCRLLKFFPAEPLGGTAMLQALAAPYAHRGLRFMPTGGLGPDRLADYLAIPQVAAVGGTWLAKRDDMSEGRWDVVRQRCAQAAELAAAARRR